MSQSTHDSVSSDLLVGIEKVIPVPVESVDVFNRTMRTGSRRVDLMRLERRTFLRTEVNSESGLE